MATIFRQAGMWVGDTGALNHADLASTLARNAFGWVALKAHHSAAPENEGLLDDAMASYRSRGVSVGLWGWLQEDPEREAEVAARLCKQHGADFYVGNAEEPYEHPPNMWKSKVFVEAFRRELPSLPLGLSCLGGSDWKRELDYEPWQRADAGCLPQVYWARAEREAEANAQGASSMLTVANCVHCMADKAGWPKDRVHPTIGLWGADYLHGADEYVRELKAAGTIGFNVFRAEQMRSEDWDVLAGALREIADVPGAPPREPPTPTEPTRGPTTLSERSEARAHLATAIDLLRQGGRSEETIRKTRVYWAERILDADDDSLADVIEALALILDADRTVP